MKKPRVYFRSNLPKSPEGPSDGVSDREANTIELDLTTTDNNPLAVYMHEIEHLKDWDMPEKEVRHRTWQLLKHMTQAEAVGIFRSMLRRGTVVED